MSLSTLAVIRAKKKPPKGITINSVLPLFTTYILDAIVNVSLTEGNKHTGMAAKNLSRGGYMLVVWR